MKIRNTMAILILAVGSLQMIGHLSGNRILRGIGIACGVAPFTKVFCESDGYEAFAASFLLSGNHPDGSRWSHDLDPALYSRLRGPYNRRNVYGAALAFAPRLPDPLRNHLLTSSLAPDSHLRRELGIPGEVENLQVTIIPRAGENHAPWTYPQQP